MAQVELLRPPSSTIHLPASPNELDQILFAHSDRSADFVAGETARRNQLVDLITVEL